MTELPTFPENREKILPNQTLLLAEPIFKSPNGDESKKSTFKVPLGAGSLIKQIPWDTLTNDNLTESFASEYLAIVAILKKMNLL